MMTVFLKSTRRRALSRDFRGPEMSARWDLSGVQRHACDLATARLTEDGVALDLGTRVPDEIHPTELHASLLRTVELDVAEAQALRKLLAAVLGR